mgnify:CR=1 FL=1
MNMNAALKPRSFSKAYKGPHQGNGNFPPSQTRRTKTMTKIFKTTVAAIVTSGLLLGTVVPMTVDARP